MELSSSLGAEFHTAVAVFGSYGTGKEQTAVWVQGVPELLAKLDSLHFWTVVKLSLSPVMIRAGSKVVDKLIDLAVDWAVRHAKAGKKAKLLIYGSDNQVIKEFDA